MAARIASAWRGARHRAAESGKIGLALLMWILGVPGFVILLFLIFA